MKPNLSRPNSATCGESFPLRGCNLLIDTNPATRSTTNPGLDATGPFFELVASGGFGYWKFAQSRLSSCVPTPLVRDPLEARHGGPASVAFSFSGLLVQESSSAKS